MVHSDTDPLSVIGRWLTYLGILLALGVAVFHRVVIRGGPMPRAAVQALATLLFVSAAATVVVAGAAGLEAGSVPDYLLSGRNGLLQLARAAVAVIGGVALLLLPAEVGRGGRCRDRARRYRPARVRRARFRTGDAGADHRPGRARRGCSGLDRRHRVPAGAGHPAGTADRWTRSKHAFAGSSLLGAGAGRHRPCLTDRCVPVVRGDRRAARHRDGVRTHAPSQDRHGARGVFARRAQLPGRRPSDGLAGRLPQPDHRRGPARHRCPRADGRPGHHASGGSADRCRHPAHSGCIRRGGARHEHGGHSRAPGTQPDRGHHDGRPRHVIDARARSRRSGLRGRPRGCHSCWSRCRG